MGSIVAMTDEHAKIVQHYNYDSFGMPTISDPDFSQPYTYTGREGDDETGLYFYRARYYDPSAGRFISKDPIGFNGGDVTLYGYVGNQPTDSIDPWGLYDIADYLYDSFMGETDNRTEYEEYRETDHQIATETTENIIIAGAATDMALMGGLVAPVIIDTLPAAYMSALSTKGGEMALNLTNTALWDVYGTGQPGYSFLAEMVIEYVSKLSANPEESTCE